MLDEAEERYRMKAFLILEDGTVFEGTHIGADEEIISTAGSSLKHRTILQK